MSIQREDVERVVGDSFGKILTEKEIDYVMKYYDSYQDQDPTGTWDLTVGWIIGNLMEMTEEEIDLGL